MESTPDDPDTVAEGDQMPEGQIPAEDLHGSAAQPESQGEDPVVSDLGEQGQGDLAPEDL